MSLALGVLVSAALALGPAPARLPQRFEDLEALVSNLAAQKDYQALADTAERGFERRDLEPSQRRLMAFFAIRGLHGVYEDTGKVANLCRARSLLRRVERDPGLEDDASTAARLGKRTAKLLAASREEKQCSKAIPAAKPPALASRPSSAPKWDAATAPESLGPTESSLTEPPAAAPSSASPVAQDDLLAVRGRSVEHVSNDMSRKTPSDVRPADASVSGAGSSSSAVPFRGQDDRPPAVRTGAAVALLAVGAGAGGALGASLYYRGQATDRIATLAAAADARGESTPEEYAEAYRLNQNHQRLTVAAWTTGAVVLVGLVTGVTLLAVKPRRTTMATPWAGPTGAGFVLRGHF